MLNKWWFSGKLKLKVTCRNIERFIKTLVANNINLLQIEYPKRNQLYIKVSDQDYEKIKMLNIKHDLEIIELYGGLKIKHLININRYVLIAIVIGYFVLLLLTNVIFEVQVIHTSSNIRKLIFDELTINGIKRLRFKKSFDELQLIEKNIINKHKDKIDWLEIEEIGTKYIIRVEERKIKKEIENIQYQHIVAERNGVIKKIEAKNGDIVRIINEYVEKGDIIISGIIKRGDMVIKNVKAIGAVYAEVWYNVRVEYPLTYREEKETGKTKIVYTFKFLNYRVPFFEFKPFRHKRIFEKIIFAHPFLPVKLAKEEQIELTIINETYTKEVALTKANKVARQKIEERLIEGEYIISERNLAVSIENDRVIANVFFAVYENIGVEQPFVVD